MENLPECVCADARRPAASRRSFALFMTPSASFVGRIIRSFAVLLLCLGGAMFASAQSTPAAPTFAPAGGVYTGPQTVVMSCSTSGVTIRYTLDGSDPTPSTPTSVLSGGSITISSNTLLKAAALSGTLLGPIVSQQYYIVGSIGGGQSHMLALGFDGKKISGFGLNWNGQVKPPGAVSGGVSGYYTPADVVLPGTGPTDATLSVDGGDQFSLAVRRVNGVLQLYSWGDNQYGTLGRGASGTYTNIAPVVGPSTGFLTDVRSAGGGGLHAAAVVGSNGQVFAWGKNTDGQIGDGSAIGTIFQRPRPVKIAGGTTNLTAVTQLSVGGLHNLVLRSDATVWAWGDNSVGQTLGTTATTANAGKATQVPLSGIKFVAAGGWASFAVRASDGAVYGWGQNTHDELGRNESMSYYRVPDLVLSAASTPLLNIVKVSAGHLHCLALDSQGKIWAWGSNLNGEMGRPSSGSLDSNPYATQIILPSVDSLGRPTDPVVDVYAGNHRSYAICGSGTVFAWGASNGGSLGSGNDANVSTPTDFSALPMLSNQPPVLANAQTRVFGSMYSPEIIEGVPYYVYPTDVECRVQAVDPNDSIARVEFSRINVGETSPTVFATVTGQDAQGFYNAVSNSPVSSTVTMTAIDTYGGRASTTLPIWLTNDQISLSVSPTSVFEDASFDLCPKFTFTRTKAAGALSVSFGLGGTALNGVDFQGVGNAVQFGAGQTEVQLSISPVNDTSAEGDETVTLEIQNQSNDYDIATPYPLLATIKDQIPIISVAGGECTEGGIAANVVFSRTGTLGALTVYVNLEGTASPFTDYQSTLTSGYVNFAAGATTALATFTATGDSVLEADETVVVNILPDPTKYTMGTASGAVVIHDALQTGSPQFWPLPNNKIRTDVITITVSDPSATIRYTTDGTEPTATSNEFSTGRPMRVNPTMTIKAKCFSPSAPPSPTVTAQYSGIGNLACGYSSSYAAYPGVDGLGGNALSGWGISGSFLAQTVPTVISGLDGASTLSIAGGDSYALAVRADGKVYAVGYNGSGALGFGPGNFTNSATFQPCAFAAGISATAVAAGSGHSLVLTSTGDVYSFGRNNYNQLGYVSVSGLSNPNPTPITGVTDVKGIAAGYAHSLAVRTDGSVLVWGSNYEGQLGLGAASDPVSSPATLTPSSFGGAKIVAVAAAAELSMALDEYGRVWEWGDITYLQAVAAPTLSPLGNAVQIAAGRRLRLALKAGGTIATVGRNNVGQRGIGYQNAASAPESTPAEVVGLADVLQIASFDEHCLAITANGDLYAWGNNLYGAVKPGPSKVSIPVKVRAASDIDADGLSDWLEERSGYSDPSLVDTNADDLSDYLSWQLGIDPESLDSDGDGWSNALELLWGTSPLLRDSDGDGTMDSLDAFPTDPSRWLAPQDSGLPFNITLDTPAGAVPL